MNKYCNVQSHQTFSNRRYLLEVFYNPVWKEDMGTMITKRQHHCEKTNPRSLLLFFQDILSLVQFQKQSVARSSIPIKESSKVQMNKQIYRIIIGYCGHQSTQNVIGQVPMLASRAVLLVPLLQESLQKSM